VCGGEQIYLEAVRDYLYLCNKVYVTKFKTDYTCTQHFPLETIKGLPQQSDPVKTRDYTRYTFLPNDTHDEVQYLKLLDETRNGEAKPDSQGPGVRSIFGKQLAFNISERLPIITTRRIFHDLIAKELLFHISGRTDFRKLEEQGVKASPWKKLTSKSELEKTFPSYEEGDMGPTYGFQWRHHGLEYQGCDKEYGSEGRDQLTEIVEALRKDPFTNVHVLSSWNPTQNDEMVTPPTQISAQFNVSGDRRFLDCNVYVSTVDVFTELPNTIATYAMMTYMMAHVSGMRPRKLVVTIGEGHISNNHMDQIKRQLTRTPRPFAKLSFRDATRIHDLSDYTFNAFIVEYYNSWAAITLE
jgi:thymidylate synthase